MVNIKIRNYIVLKRGRLEYMKKYIIFILIATLIISFILGLYAYRLKKVNEEIAFDVEYTKERTNNIITQAQNILKETSSNKNTTSPNTKLIEKIYYKDCGHLKQTEKEMREDLVNKTEEEFRLEYAGWELQTFTINEVMVYKEIQDFCDEHFLLKDVDGKINVYKLDKNDREKELFKKTEIQTKYLSELDIENLEKGMKVYGNKELNQLLEDFE